MPDPQPQNPLNQAPKTHSERNWLVFVFLLFVVVVGMAWFYLNNSANVTSNGNYTPVKKVTQAKPDPTKDWTIFSSTSGEYSLKYKPTWTKVVCPDGTNSTTLLLGPDQNSVGKCETSFVGQIVISSDSGNEFNQPPFDTSNYSNITETDVTVDSSPGKRYAAVVSGQLPGYPVGTKVVVYLFYTNNKTYHIDYQQEPSGQTPSQDVLSDFELMVKNTFKFSA